MNAGINDECHKLPANLVSLRMRIEDEDEERYGWTCSQTDFSFLYFPNLLKGGYYSHVR